MPWSILTRAEHEQDSNGSRQRSTARARATQNVCRTLRDRITALSLPLAQVTGRRSAKGDCIHNSLKLQPRFPRPWEVTVNSLLTLLGRVSTACGSCFHHPMLCFHNQCVTTLKRYFWRKGPFYARTDVPRGFSKMCAVNSKSNWRTQHQPGLGCQSIVFPPPRDSLKLCSMHIPVACTTQRKARLRKFIFQSAELKLKPNTIKRTILRVYIP